MAVFDNGTAINDYILTFAHLFPDNDHNIYYGLDTEFEQDGTLTVLSLAFPRSMGAGAEGLQEEDRIPVAIVIHLHKISRTQFPGALQRLLEQPNMIPVGCLICTDCSKLEDQYGIEINRRIELRNLCMNDRDRDLGSYGLQNLMEEYLQCTYPMNKSSSQKSSYAKAELTDVDNQYCALDAAVSLWVFQQALASLSKRGHDPHPTLQVGKRCTVTHNNREIAVGRLEFVGAWGEQRRWGDKRLGRVDCLVAIESLIDGDFVPRRRNSSWPTGATTLRNLHNHDNVPTLELAVTVNQVKILLEDGERMPGALEWDAAVQSFEADKCYLNKLIESRSQNIVTMTTELPQNESEPTEEKAPEQTTVETPPSNGSVGPMGEVAGGEERINNLSEESNVITNSLRDLFHQFHNIPLKKGSEEIALVFQLLLAATWINDEEDYANVVEVVVNKGFEDVFLHEFFNRNYWRERVKRDTPLPLDHANKMLEKATAKDQMTTKVKWEARRLERAILAARKLRGMKRMKSKTTQKKTKRWKQ